MSQWSMVNGLEMGGVDRVTWIGYRRPRTVEKPLTDH